jgi:hypothetical protein
VSNPPGFSPPPSRGRPGGLLTPPCQCPDPSQWCARSADGSHTCSSLAYAPAISRASQCRFGRLRRLIIRSDSAITSPSWSGARRCQGSTLRSDPLRGPAGLDDACAPLEGSTYVMAEEARRMFSVLTQAAARRIVKISSVPLCTLSAVASDAERCRHRSQSYAAAPSTTN